MILLHHLLFCATGVINVLLVQYINMYQVTDIKLGVPSFATYFGYFLAYPAMFKFREPGVIRYHYSYIFIFLTDIIGSSLCFLSVYLAGGQLFTVAYASIIIWATLLKRIVIKEKFNLVTIGSILMIVVGLALSSVSSMSYGTYVEWGILCGLIGAFVYSIQYVVSEWVTTTYDACPYSMTAFCGMNGLVLSTLYLILYSFPQMKQHLPDYTKFTVTFISLAVSTFIHSVTFFKISKTPKPTPPPTGYSDIQNVRSNFGAKFSTYNRLMYGAVIIGINKALQTALTFIFNHIFFCNKDEIECMTPSKVISIFLVFIGIILYSSSNAIIKRCNRSRPLLEGPLLDGTL